MALMLRVGQYVAKIHPEDRTATLMKVLEEESSLGMYKMSYTTFGTYLVLFPKYFVEITNYYTILEDSFMSVPLTDNALANINSSPTCLRVGDAVIYCSSYKTAELGIIKSFCDDGKHAFVYYHEGSTAARTEISQLYMLSNPEVISKCSINTADERWKKA